MLILGLETATPWGSMALIDQDETVFEISLNAPKGGGEYLLSLMDHLLKKTNRKISDLELIAVGTGPGSYTGIRVGLAAAKGLAEGLNIPVQGISTLRIIAENARYGYEWIAPMIDARRGDIYAALYQSTNTGLFEIESPIAVSASGFAAKISDLSKVVCCGNGSKIYQTVWSQNSRFEIGPVEWDRPFGSQVARIGGWEFNRFMKTDALEITPCYLRKVEAEIRWEEGLRGNQNRTDANRRP